MAARPAAPVAIGVHQVPPPVPKPHIAIYRNRSNALGHRATAWLENENEGSEIGGCREHRIPKPEVNARVGKYRPDFMWRQARLIVEVDSYRYHADRASFRLDRARDRFFANRGFTVLRFADEELAHEPRAVAGSVFARVAQRAQE
jgi:very-short-patch-repair endonuclease